MNSPAERDDQRPAASDADLPPGDGELRHDEALSTAGRPAQQQPGRFGGRDRAEGAAPGGSRPGSPRSQAGEPGNQENDRPDLLDDDDAVVLSREDAGDDSLASPQGPPAAVRQDAPAFNEPAAAVTIEDPLEESGPTPARAVVPGDQAVPVPGDRTAQMPGDRTAGVAGDRAGHDNGGPWHEIQATFVDDPRRSVELAASLAGDSASALVALVQDRLSSLDATWQSGDDDTEQLRAALRQYRDLWARLGEFSIGA
ncbi:MAG TPA: hypothetical protein VGI64_20655 [Streptosporangiaceae bacterium]|jgi:hypothetical protein